MVNQNAMLASPYSEALKLNFGNMVLAGYGYVIRDCCSKVVQVIGSPIGICDSNKGRGH